jgi:hypothetical protein
MVHEKGLSEASEEKGDLGCHGGDRLCMEAPPTKSHDSGELIISPPSDFQAAVK